MFHKRIFQLLTCAAVSCLMASAVSCSALEKNYADNFAQETVSPSDHVVLLDNDAPILSMIVSDELLTNMRTNGLNKLQLLQKYFNLMVNEEIEENVVYIRALNNVTSPSDCDQRLISVEEYMRETDLSAEHEKNSRIVKASVPLLDQAAVFGRDAVEASASEKKPLTDSILNGSLLALDGASPYSEEIARQMVADRKAAVAKILSKAKTALREAAPYGKTAYEEILARQTAASYRTSSELLSEGPMRSLKYKDYYISSDENEIAIVCGSLDSAQEALDYFRTEYIESGKIDGSRYLINEPKTEAHEGQYLNAKVSGKSLNEYTIVYSKDSQYYDSEQPADYLNDYFLKNLGRKLNVNNYNYTSVLNQKLVIGKVPYTVSTDYYNQSPDICSYQIDQESDDLYILGGSDWAIQYAVDYMIDEYFSQDKNVPKNFHKSGSIYGMYLFDKYDGSDVRIMTNNVWDKPCNTAVWEESGENCSNNARLKEMAKAYMAYNPDVLALQEMNHYFINYLIEKVNESGRNYKVADRIANGNIYRNCTPILYNADTVELLESDAHVFRYASNANSKSYTWGYFKDKKSGEDFIVFSTHLWWQKDKNYPKSSYYREKQIEEVCTKADELIAKYNCPCFIMGDFNCTASAQEYGTLTAMGYDDCHTIATQYAEDASGRYVCNGRAFSYKPNDATYRKSIDHIAAKNLTQGEVLSYDYVTPNFYGKLSDHAPLYVDVKLD